DVVDAALVRPHAVDHLAQLLHLLVDDDGRQLELQELLGHGIARLGGAAVVGTVLGVGRLELLVVATQQVHAARDLDRIRAADRVGLVRPAASASASSRAGSGSSTSSSAAAAASAAASSAAASRSAKPATTSLMRRRPSRCWS